MVKKSAPSSMSGFKDIIDLATPARKNESVKSRESYAIYSFLDQEYRRLIALDDLLSEKFINIKRYPQTEKILLREVYKKNLLKEELSQKLLHRDSPLNVHLRQIFDSSFK